MFSKIYFDDIQEKNQIKIVSKFPKRIKTPWFLFKWLCKPIEFKEGFYYNTSKYHEYIINTNEIEVDGKLYTKPYVIIRVTKIAGNGGFERKIYYNSDEEAQDGYNYFTSMIKNRL